MPYNNNGQTFGKVARFDLANFRPGGVQVLDLTDTDPDLKGFTGGFADNLHGYFVPNFNGEYFGKLARVDLGTFSHVQVLDLTATDADLKGFSGGFYGKDNYGYIVPRIGSKVARVDLKFFSEAQVLDLSATDPDLKGFQGGFASDDYGYFVPNNDGDGGAYSGKVARFAQGQSCVLPL